MQILHTVHIRGVYLAMVCLLTLLLLPGLSLSQAQEDDTTAAPEDDTVAIPGVPPGQDVDSGRGAGLQLEGQRQPRHSNEPKSETDNSTW